ncbi:hypothetical protein RO3G_12991 [Rhizopus delemar RA 99-880]|uniref:SH3 domain-containing protein n=1 Tax=Rhizopus delemar (strain RA 99-880 / ATCC MYA-4621 / FGSC 9543 / NRRL 43880) TaxID=246409 RepID=I1CIK0_RHIO9|nr:hypothetical protein RO3G_12991 [Rhizopus delemar RA 99-880]|eukprot:EIE88280.1 hypothetical protein RO3G_12991 [Rhizopus delemar RA 99-880]
MTELIFANNFWGMKDEGFNVLTAKMNSNKKTFDEIKSFYNVRTLYALLSSAHKEMEWAAQSHLNLAQKLKTRLEVDLDNFILEQKDKRKLAHANIEKVYRYKVSSEAYLAKVKENPNLIFIEQEYKTSCIKLADATEQWNKAWKMTCDTYQGMEKKRLEFLHHSFSMYINVLSTASSQDLESYERFWKALDNYDPEGDIQTFIKEKGTGPKIPEPEVFVDYLDDPSKNYEKYTLANFDCPSELVADHPPKPELTVRNLTEETNVPIVERKQSIVRNAIKPLPSISTPLVRSRKKSILKRSSSIKVTTKEEQQKPELQQQQQDKKEGVETKSTDENGDIKIDPRAKVVFAIGNNMFDLGNLAAAEEPKKNNTKAFRRRSTVRQRQADLDPSINFSYQSLLEELGIFENKESHTHSVPPKEPSTTSSSEEEEIIVTRSKSIKQHELQQENQKYYIPQHQQPYYQYPPPTTNTLSNSYYTRQNIYQPVSYPSTTMKSNRPILFWAFTLTDWYSNKPEELQYTRGTWIAITDNSRNDGWYYGIKYDNRINSLSNEKGYVAQHCVQLQE